MTSTNPDHDVSRPTESRFTRGLDPVHPTQGALKAPDARVTVPNSQTGQPSQTNQSGQSGQTNPNGPADSPTSAPTSRAAAAGRAPQAADLGIPAILDHHVVAVETGAAASPVAVHAWREGRVETTLLHPVEAQVWARAGRLTLICPSGAEHRLTVLAPDECRKLDLGAHWPRQSENRAKRIAAAAAHDLGDVLTFPAWLARTAHISGERNRVLKELVHRIREASPKTMVCYAQSFSHQHAVPHLHHPYDHRGLVGHEGYPREL
jgi:hypothetical protein